MIHNLLFFFSMAAFIVLFLAVIVVQVVVKFRIKKFHANSPIGICCAGGTHSGQSSKSLNFLRFLTHKEYILLDDNRLSKLCAALKVLYICYIFVFLWVCFEILFMPLM